MMSGRHWLSKSYPVTVAIIFFEKVIRLQGAQELEGLGDSAGSISFAASSFRLYEPKSREGVLGPDLRVLILPEYY